MMNEPKKSDPAKVASRSANKIARAMAESAERRAGTKGNANQQSTDRDSVPGSRVTSAGARTSSSKNEEKGTVHCAASPRQRRPVADVILRAEAPSGTGRRRSGRITRCDWRVISKICRRGSIEAHLHPPIGIAYVPADALPCAASETSQSVNRAGSFGHSDADG
jgi:hypothetical protein